MNINTFFKSNKKNIINKVEKDTTICWEDESDAFVYFLYGNLSARDEEELIEAISSDLIDSIHEFALSKKQDFDYDVIRKFIANNNLLIFSEQNI